MDLLGIEVVHQHRTIRYARIQIRLDVLLENLLDVITPARLRLPKGHPDVAGRGARGLAAVGDAMEHHIPMSRGIDERLRPPHVAQRVERFHDAGLSVRYEPV